MINFLLTIAVKDAYNQSEMFKLFIKLTVNKKRSYIIAPFYTNQNYDLF